jgi:hypothetical protein
MVVAFGFIAHIHYRGEEVQQFKRDAGMRA